MFSDALERFSELADELRAAWEGGRTIPDLVLLLRRNDQLSPEQVVELCLRDQAFRWQSPQPLRVEDYLALCPVIAQQPELVFELLYGEVRTRQQLGDPPSAEEIQARFPESADRLQQQLEVGFWMDNPTVPRSQTAVSPAAVCAFHKSGRFGPYELGEAIAHGGMGVVFRARHVQLNRIVALKMIRPDRVANSADHRRFHQETVTIAQLDHPHIVPIYDVGEVDGVHYFTMKLMEGGDLQLQCDRYINDQHAAARAMAQVAQAVHHAHQSGVLHRDLKPSNVLLDHFGTPFVTDFGLACRLDETVELPGSGEMLGTPAYLAPERLEPDPGVLTVAADVYGLGAVLYVLLTGRPPFTAEHLSVMLDSIRNRDPQRPRLLNHRVDPDLEQVCLKALAKRPEERYASAGEFADDLHRFLSGSAVRARPVSWWQRRWRWVRRHPDLAALGSVISVAAIVVLSLLGVQTLRLNAARHSLENSLQTARAREREAEVNRRESDRLRRSATELQDAARAAREEAVRQQRTARETAYAASIHHIEMAWRAGDTVEFSRLLDAQVPAPGQPDVRGFEWFLLDRMHRPGSQRLPLLAAAVRCVAFSPDGRWLAAAGNPGQIQVIDAASGRTHASWISLTTIRDLAFSSDGALLATVGDDGVLRLYPSEGGAPQTWPVATLPVWQVGFLNGSTLVATCDQDGIVRLIDHRDGQGVATWSNEPGLIHSMCVAPDGHWLAGRDRNGSVTIWDPATRETVYQFEHGARSTIKCLAVSLDGTRLATGCTDNLVHVFRLSRPWAHETILTGQHFDRLQRVAFSADGQRVAGCDKNGSVRVWRLRDAAAGPAAEVCPPTMAWQAHRGRAYAVAFDPRHERLVTGGHENHVAIWPLDAGSTELALGEPGRRTGMEHSLAFSPDAPHLIAAASDGVQIWDLASRTMHSRLPCNGEPYDHLAVCRDGRFLAAGRDGGRVVEVWRKTPEGYEELWEAMGQPNDHLAFSPDGNWLAVANWTDDEVRVYDPATGAVAQRIPAKQCRQAAFSPDGHRLAFTEEDDIVVWNWTARRPERRLRGHVSTVTSVTFSPDGSQLASCGRDRRVNLWDLQGGQLLRTMMGHRAFVAQVAFVGPDRLVSLGEDGTVLVWHSELGLQLCSLREDEANPCYQVTVSPDQRWLALRLADGRIPLLELNK